MSMPVPAMAPPPPVRMRIGLCQCASVRPGPAAVAKFLALAEDQSERGCGLIVLPELFVGGFAEREVYLAEADAITQTLQAFARICRDCNLHALVGAPEFDGVAIHNSVFWISSTGELHRAARKVVLYSATEKATFDVATTDKIVEIAGMRVGVLICYEVNFPEIVGIIQRKGVDLIVVPTASTSHFDYVPEILVRSRAIEFGIPVVYVNQVGPIDTAHFGGKSGVAWPSGKFMCLSSDLEENHSFRFDADRPQQTLPYVYGTDRADIDRILGLIA